VYKDASDVSDGEDSSGDQAMSDEEAEEEIKEIPLGQKRRHMDQSYSDAEEGEDEIDDSVSDSEGSSDGDEDMADSDEGPDERIASSDSGFDDQSEQSDPSAEIIRKKKK
jgi:hypothetical protein